MKLFAFTEEILNGKLHFLFSATSILPEVLYKKGALKCTIMQIWKSPYMYKQYSENFAFFMLRIRKLLAREVCKFLKK